MLLVTTSKALVTTSINSNLLFTDYITVTYWILFSLEPRLQAWSHTGLKIFAGLPQTKIPFCKSTWHPPHYTELIPLVQELTHPCVDVFTVFVCFVLLQSAVQGRKFRSAGHLGRNARTMDGSQKGRSIYWWWGMWDSDDPDHLCPLYLELVLSMEMNMGTNTCRKIPVAKEHPRSDLVTSC